MRVSRILYAVYILQQKKFLFDIDVVFRTLGISLEELEGMSVPTIEEMSSILGVIDGNR